VSDQLSRKLCGGVSCNAEGTIQAVVATLNVVDKDREVILPGAIVDGSRVKLSAYGHGAMFGEMPVGKGTLHVEGGQVVFRGRYFGTTAAGREAAALMKELADDQQFSFGFRVLKSSEPDARWRALGAVRVLERIDPFEVSPVLIGAGIGTRTISAKCSGCGGASGASCGCRTAKHPDPAEVEQLARDVTKTLERHEAFEAALAEGHQGRLALDVAAKAVRWISGGRMQEPPIVRFFDFDGRRGGYFDPTEPDSIFVSRGLADLETISATAHEVAHWLRPWDAGEEVPRIEAESVVRRYLARFEGN
jgi:phage head maturation protease